MPATAADRPVFWSTLSLSFLAALAVGAGNARAEAPQVVELTQTACQFVEVEDGGDHGFSSQSKADCEAINAESGADRLASAKVLELEPGNYVFRVSNKNVPYALGFWLREKGYDDANAVKKLTMAMGLKVRLRVLVPAVENAVSGNAFRPLDVLQTRKGLTVEVGNTDAEGRLVLADALAEADREKPDLILDYATLTGAARVALGTDLPALFCNDDRMADALLRHANAEGDPLWRLPLHRPYRPQLDSKVADLNNISDAPFGGAITAALFMANNSLTFFRSIMPPDKSLGSFIFFKPRNTYTITHDYYQRKCNLYFLLHL